MRGPPRCQVWQAEPPRPRPPGCRQADGRLSWLRARLSRTLGGAASLLPTWSSGLQPSRRAGVPWWPPPPVCTACLEQTADRPWGQTMQAGSGFLDPELPPSSWPRPRGRSPEATLPARLGVGPPPWPAPPVPSPRVGRQNWVGTLVWLAATGHTGRPPWVVGSPEAFPGVWPWGLAWPGHPAPAVASPREYSPLPESSRIPFLLVLTEATGDGLQGKQ